MNIREIANNIFSEQIKSPQSIQLQLSDSNTTDDIFNIMLEFFQIGMVFFHGENEKVDLNNISEDDFFKLRKYFWSFGFEIFYKIYDLNGNLLLKNNEYENKSDLYQKFITLKTDFFKYEISFDYYKSA